MSQFQQYSVLPSGDYLIVVCAEHQEQCDLSFHGFDPAMPLVEIKCPKCGSSGTWKLHGFS